MTAASSLREPEAEQQRAKLLESDVGIGLSAENSLEDRLTPDHLGPEGINWNSPEANLREKFGVRPTDRAFSRAVPPRANASTHGIAKK